MEQLKEIFSVIEPAVWSVVGLLVVYLLKQGLDKWKEKGLKSEIYEALRIGVDDAQERFVTWHKRASEDGKLTKEERQEAMRIAIEVARTHLGGEALKLLLTWSFEQVQSVIKQYVEKKKAAENKTIIVETANVDNSASSANPAAPQ